MPEKPPLYRSYLLRCWTEHGYTAGHRGRWRFSVEDVRTATRHGFTTWEARVTFLRTELLDETAGAHDAPAEE